MAASPRPRTVNAPSTPEVDQVADRGEPVGVTAERPAGVAGVAVRQVRRASPKHSAGVDPDLHPGEGAQGTGTRRAATKESSAAP